MFNSQLYFFVAIVLISKHSQASTPSSDVDDSWQYDAKSARVLIRSSQGTVKDFPGAPGNQSLVEAEQSITAVMNITDPKEILGGLAIALASDVDAFFAVKDGCSKLANRQEICNIVCAAIKLSMRYLIAAIRKLKLAEAIQILRDFLSKILTKSKDHQELRDLMKDAMNAMKFQ